ncbi:protein turtle homolog B-like [Branchiostoma lanceolatum]|uniref:protein turtle homolog B-like n=1 Tax=Branchiostoma lanceolatum TaxID=7740 RepID=UPI00345628D8
MQPCGITRVALLFAILTGVSCQSVRSIHLKLPEKMDAISGDPVTLPATFSTDRRVMNIAWYKLDPREPTSRTQIFSYYPPLQTRESYGDYVGRTSLEDQASLRIARTKPADEGKYILSVSVEGVGSSEGQVQLVLMGKVHAFTHTLRRCSWRMMNCVTFLVHQLSDLIFSVPPTVRVGPSNPYVITRGRSTSLTCAVEGAKPNITSLHWEKDGEVVDPRRQPAKYSHGNAAVPGLHIRHVGKSDAGVYACVADHVVKTVRASLQVKVHYPPSILSISDSLSASVADSVSVQCVADGNPPPNITWSRDGTRLRSAVHSVTSDMRTSTVKLSNVRVNDSGKYVCQANNGVGRGASSSLVLNIRESRLGVTSSTVAVVVGASAGGLWFIVCVALAAYLVKRRRLQDEKKKFAFYYNMGRREPTERVEAGEDKEPPPYTAMAGKPSNKAPNYGGINTIRKSIGRKERRYARVVYSYRPREENELRLEVDDVIEVLEGEDGGWCLGYLRGRIGLFPSNYVRFISSSEVLALKAVGVHQTIEVRDSTPSNGSI